MVNIVFASVRAVSIVIVDVLRIRFFKIIFHLISNSRYVRMRLVIQACFYGNVYSLFIVQFLLQTLQNNFVEFLFFKQLRINVRG